ncbi:hypothetical protein [Rhizobium sp. BK251]|uniref:hypothetical protein n=1 Tax=Rhizobium sp. BK251 TaxID=2512125 RepID=UPI00104DCE0A|nr:hypothetical protein [Rhizobium sp. BK251]TCL68085.1 hypothetical protein EV286_10912 [Rhizobium sp. BK251]
MNVSDIDLVVPSSIRNDIHNFCLALSGCIVREAGSLLAETAEQFSAGEVILAELRIPPEKISERARVLYRKAADCEAFADHLVGKVPRTEDELSEWWAAALAHDIFERRRSTSD